MTFDSLRDSRKGFHGAFVAGTHLDHAWAPSPHMHAPITPPRVTSHLAIIAGIRRGEEWKGEWKKVSMKGEKRSDPNRFTPGQQHACATPVRPIVHRLSAHLPGVRAWWLAVEFFLMELTLIYIHGRNKSISFCVFQSTFYDVDIIFKYLKQIESHRRKHI